MNIKLTRIDNNKPEIVLLHGWGTTSDIWEPWLPLLNESFSITCIDLPGLGGSVVTSEEYTLDNLLEKVALKIPQNSLLLGWSLGGLFAVLLAKKLAKKILGVVTIAYNPCFVERSDWPTAMAENVFKQFSQDLQLDSEKTLARFFMLQVRGASQQRPILKLLKAINQQSNHSNLAGSLALLEIDSRLDLASLIQPSLHFYGEFDQLAPSALVNVLPTLNSRLNTLQIKGAGHLLFLSDPEEVSLQVADFFHTIDKSKN
ncbi:MAG: alpha/beta fold hydrolase [Oceanospirillaceae bacterium]